MTVRKLSKYSSSRREKLQQGDVNVIEHTSVITRLTAARDDFESDAEHHDPDATHWQLNDHMLAAAMLRP